MTFSRSALTQTAQCSGQQTVRRYVQWTATRSAPRSSATESGGAIIAWQDKRSGSYDIYAQRVNGSGALQWSPPTGVSVCTAVFDQVNIAMVSDGERRSLAYVGRLSQQRRSRSCRYLHAERSMQQAYRNGLQTVLAYAHKQPHNMVRGSSATEAAARLLHGMTNARAIMTSTPSV